MDVFTATSVLRPVSHVAEIIIIQELVIDVAVVTSSRHIGLPNGPVHAVLIIIIIIIIIIHFVERHSAVASEALAEQVSYLYAVLNK